MARKSRKHPELTVPVSKDTVGYIRLSVLNRDPHGSIENQRLMIEEWGHQHQIPIMRYYIDNGFSYMTQAGVREPPEGTPRRAQFDLYVNYLVLDSWDRRDVSFVGTSTAENPSFRRLLNQLKLTEPDVSNLDTSGSGEGDLL